MNKYRYAPLALVACAAGLSLAACSAGVTAATSTPAASRSTGSSASSTASASSSPSNSSSPGRTVTVEGLISTFPIPAGAKLDENVTDDKTILIFLSTVTPTEVSSFYTSALPRAGYTITTNSVTDLNGVKIAAIDFTGHGYKGAISAASKLPASQVSLGGVSNKNFTGITLTQQ
jgi:hypothetical protein